MQLKWQKTKNEVTKICNEPGSCYMLIFLRVWAYTWNGMVYVEFVEFVKFDNSALLQSKPSCPSMKAAKDDYLFTVMTTVYKVEKILKGSLDLISSPSLS